MKLHPNVEDQDLAYRFQDTQSTVTWYMKKWYIMSDWAFSLKKINGQTDELCLWILGE